MALSESLIDISLFTKTLLSKCCEKYSLTYQQVVLINNIPALDGIAISELSKKMGVDISTLSRNIKKMEKKELILRKGCDKDARSFKIYATPNAEKINNDVISEFDKIISKILANNNFSPSSSFIQNIELISWELYKFLNDEK